MTRVIAVLAGVVLGTTGCLGLVPPPVQPGTGVQRTVTIRVEGTPGLSFEGSYGTAQGTSSVRGTVPALYTVTTAVAVAATFTKTREDGELIVRLLIDDREVARRATTHPYGTITLTAQVR